MVIRTHPPQYMVQSRDLRWDFLCHYLLLCTAREDLESTRLWSLCKSSCRSYCWRGHQCYFGLLYTLHSDPASLAATDVTKAQNWSICHLCGRPSVSSSILMVQKAG